uniref:Uncharacterized protein n=1 Tax=Pavo cristatus TaxID=9049 RepID=A0A8C9F923_PAVCR
MCCRRLTFYCYLCCFCPFLVNLLGDEANSESRLSRRGQPQTVKDAFAALQSNVRSSLVRILKARENLTSLQALEGSRELENIIGVSDSSCILSAEVQKTQALMMDIPGAYCAGRGALCRWHICNRNSESQRFSCMRVCVRKVLSLLQASGSWDF